MVPWMVIKYTSEIYSPSKKQILMNVVTCGLNSVLKEDCALEKSKSTIFRETFT